MNAAGLMLAVFLWSETFKRITSFYALEEEGVE